jgi:DNA-binding CsgD family transcriptional regulator
MLPVLTNRENQILRLIADGLTNREISSSLSISESTVENHIHHIYEKMGISNRAQPIAHFFRLKTSSQNDTQIEGILHDRMGDKFHHINGINTSINCHNFSDFHLFEIMELIPSLLQRVLKCYPF